MHFIPKAPPAPIHVNGALYGQRALVTHLLDSCRVFNASGPGIRASVRIERAFAADTWPVALDDADWALLRDAAETPDAGYCPALTMQGPDGVAVPLTIPGRTFVGMVDAIANAPDKPPAPEVIAEAPHAE